jgi:hypothetical protein
MISVNATYEQWFQHDTSVQFNSCTMLIVEEMSKKSLTIIVQCVNKVICYLKFLHQQFEIIKIK